MNLTFAVRPISRQSCSSTLSSREVARGLRKNKDTLSRFKILYQYHPRQKVSCWKHWYLFPPGRFPQKYRALWAGLTFTASMRMGLHCQHKWRETKTVITKQQTFLYSYNCLHLIHHMNKRQSFCHYLKEAAYVSLVDCTHGNHILKKPEERTVIIILGPHHCQHSVKLKEQPSSSFCE